MCVGRVLLALGHEVIFFKDYDLISSPLEGPKGCFYMIVQQYFLCCRYQNINMLRLGTNCIRSFPNKSN